MTASASEVAAEVSALQQAASRLCPVLPLSLVLDQLRAIVDRVGARRGGHLILHAVPAFACTDGCKLACKLALTPRQLLLAWAMQASCWHAVSSFCLSGDPAQCWQGRDKLCSLFGMPVCP